MAYTPTTWTAGTTPCSKANMDNLETQYGLALDDYATINSATASDTLKHSNDALKSATTTSYVKVKEILLVHPMPACRVKFDLYTDGGAYAAFGKIYKNGIAIGTERSTNNTETTTFSEDFADFVATDLIQVYAKRTPTAVAYVQNFRLYYNRGISQCHDWVLGTALEVGFTETNQDP